MIVLVVVCIVSLYELRQALLVSSDIWCRWWQASKAHQLLQSPWRAFWPWYFQVISPFTVNCALRLQSSCHLKFTVMFVELLLLMNIWGLLALLDALLPCNTQTDLLQGILGFCLVFDRLWCPYLCSKLVTYPLTFVGLLAEGCNSFSVRDFRGWTNGVHVTYLILDSPSDFGFGWLGN